MNLLCRIGIHRPGYQPALRHSYDTRWLQLSVCTRCHRPIERHHR